MWPRSCAEEVVNAVADQGLLVLGLDLRSDGQGQAPAGLTTEIAWSSFQPHGDSVAESVHAAREQALQALRRADLEEFYEFEWVVLITWGAHNDPK
jgi:hypothetical protein